MPAVTDEPDARVIELERALAAARAELAAIREHELPPEQQIRMAKIRELGARTLLIVMVILGMAILGPIVGGVIAGVLGNDAGFQFATEYAKNAQLDSQQTAALMILSAILGRQMLKRD